MEKREPPRVKRRRRVECQRNLEISVGTSGPLVRADPQRRPSRTDRRAARPYPWTSVATPDTKKPSAREGLKWVAAGQVADLARPAYFFAGALRLNFEVNFSTRPAVSTRRFSPV